MTATMQSTPQPTELWNAMPGWGIAADLIPPELVNARRLKVLQKQMAAGLVLLLLVCAAGYYLANRQKASAANSLAAAQARSAQLQAQANAPQYKAVTQIQGTVTQVQSQVAGLLAGDVDLVRLLNALRSSLPKPMTINQETVTITQAAVAGASTSSTTGLDTSGLPHIGTVTIGGTGHALTDLAAYVDRLKAIPGVVDVTPISNTASKTGVTFNVTLGLTTAVLSHRFDTTKGTR